MQARNFITINNGQHLLKPDENKIIVINSLQWLVQKELTLVEAVVGEDTGPREKILIKQTNHGGSLLKCNNYKPVYWKNGVRYSLPPGGGGYARLKALAINGNDVYAAGFEAGPGNEQMQVRDFRYKTHRKS